MIPLLLENDRPQSEYLQVYLNGLSLREEEEFMFNLRVDTRDPIYSITERM